MRHELSILVLPVLLFFAALEVWGTGRTHGPSHAGHVLSTGWLRWISSTRASRTR